MGFLSGMFTGAGGTSSNAASPRGAFSGALNSESSDDGGGTIPIPAPSEALLRARSLVKDSSGQGDAWLALRGLIRVCDLAEKLASQKGAQSGHSAKITMACHAIQSQILVHAEELDRLKAEPDLTLALFQLDRTVGNAWMTLGKMKASASSMRWFTANTYRDIKKILKSVDHVTKEVVAKLVEAASSERHHKAVTAAGRRGSGAMEYEAKRELDMVQAAEKKAKKAREKDIRVRRGSDGGAVLQEARARQEAADAAAAAARAEAEYVAREAARVREVNVMDEQVQAQIFQESNKYFFGTDGIAQNYEKALQLYKSLAHAGHIEAQAQLGLMYRNGFGCNQDFSIALSWYERAARLGNIDAYAALGSMTEEGEGQPQDYPTAAAFYAAAAEEGHAEAQANLAYLYEKGLGLPNKDYTKALDWYYKSAQNGNARAQNNLGKLYFEGLGVAREYSKAVRWFTLAAQQGNPSAMNNLGICYEDGLGVECDMAAAARLYQQAASKGHTGACSNLAYIAVTNGQYEEAEQLYSRTAAGQNSAEVLYSLGLLCEYGRGSPSATLAYMTSNAEREEMALSYYTRAADMGDARAQHRIAAALYDKGDLTGSLRYYRLSAGQGNGDALNALGVMFEDGLGVACDLNAAMEYYKQSAFQGCVEGEKNMRALEQRLVQEAEAQESSAYQRSRGFSDTSTPDLTATGHDNSSPNEPYDVDVYEAERSPSGEANSEEEDSMQNRDSPTAETRNKKTHMGHARSMSSSLDLEEFHDLQSLTGGEKEERQEKGGHAKEGVQEATRLRGDEAGPVVIQKKALPPRGRNRPAGFRSADAKDLVQGGGALSQGHRRTASVGGKPPVYSGEKDKYATAMDSVVEELPSSVMVGSEEARDLSKVASAGPVRSRLSDPDREGNEGREEKPLMLLRDGFTTECVMPMGIHMGPTSGFAFFPSKGGGDAPLDMPMDRVTEILRAHEQVKPTEKEKVAWEKGDAKLVIDGFTDLKTTSMKDLRNILCAALHIGPILLGTLPFSPVASPRKSPTASKSNSPPPPEKTVTKQGPPAPLPPIRTYTATVSTHSTESSPPKQTLTRTKSISMAGNTISMAGNVISLAQSPSQTAAPESSQASRPAHLHSISTAVDKLALTRPGHNRSTSDASALDSAKAVPKKLTSHSSLPGRPGLSGAQLMRSSSLPHEGGRDSESSANHATPPGQSFGSSVPAAHSRANSLGSAKAFPAGVSWANVWEKTSPGPLGPGDVSRAMTPRGGVQVEEASVPPTPPPPAPNPLDSRDYSALEIPKHFWPRPVVPKPGAVAPWVKSTAAHKQGIAHLMGKRPTAMQDTKAVSMAKASSMPSLREQHDAASASRTTTERQVQYHRQTVLNHGASTAGASHSQAQGQGGGSSKSGQGYGRDSARSNSYGGAGVSFSGSTVRPVPDNNGSSHYGEQGLPRSSSASWVVAADKSGQGHRSSQPSSRRSSHDSMSGAQSGGKSDKNGNGGGEEKGYRPNQGALMEKVKKIRSFMPGNSSWDR